MAAVQHSPKKFARLAEKLTKDEPDVYQVMRVVGSERIPVDADDVLKVPAKYELHGRERDGLSHEVLGECCVGAEPDAGAAPRTAAERGLEKLTSEWAVMVASLQRENDRVNARNVELERDKAERDRLINELKDALREATAGGEFPAAELVGLMKQGLEVWRTYNFRAQLKERLNRVLPHESEEDRAVIVAAMNHPEMMQ